MHLLAVLSVVLLIALGSEVSADNGKLEALFPDGGLRYKSCRVFLRAHYAGYKIDVTGNPPSGKFPSLFRRISIRVNSQEMQSGSRTLKNYHRIDSDSTTSTLWVREFRTWRVGTGLDLSGDFIMGRSKDIGYTKRILKMRIANDTGEIEEFAAYRQTYRNPSVFGSVRNRLISHLKASLIGCE